MLGAFSCKGYDTFGPFKLVGGIAKGHPDERDLENARAFYRQLRARWERGEGVPPPGGLGSILFRPDCYRRPRIFTGSAA